MSNGHNEKDCINCSDRRSSEARDLMPVPAVPDDVNSRLAAAAPIDTQTGERMAHLGNRGPMSKDMKEALAAQRSAEATACLECGGVGMHGSLCSDWRDSADAPTKPRGPHWPAGSRVQRDGYGACTIGTVKEHDPMLWPYVVFDDGSESSIAPWMLKAAVETNPPSPERDRTRLLIARARQAGDVLDFGMGLEAKIIAALQEASNEAQWQDLWEAARDLREAEHKPTRALHAAHVALYNALDALGGPPPRRERATPVWFNDPEHFKGVLEKIALHPERSEAIYNLAADALCWARKHKPAPVDPMREALAGLLDNIRAHQRHECPGITPRDCLDAIYEAAEVARHALDPSPSSSDPKEGG